MKDLPQVLFYLAMLAALVWALVRISQRAGYSGWMAVLYLIPVVNVLTFFWFAAAEWPVEEKLRRLRAGTPRPGPAPSEEEAWDLYHEATGLEVAGRAAEALPLFLRIIETCPNTEVAQDAQKSIDALRSKLT